MQAPTGFRTRMKSGLLRVTEPATIAVTLLTLSLMYFGFLDWRIERIVSDPGFRQSIAERVRPSVTFNWAGVVLQEAGALRYLTDVPTVENSEVEGGLLMRITFETREFMSSQPVAEALDFGFVQAKTNRLRGNRWEVQLFVEFGTAPKEPRESGFEQRFRLELRPD